MIVLNYGVTMIMAAGRFLPGGQQAEKTKHCKPESACQGEGPKVRGQILVHTAAGVKI
jgi:hypothetical protein